MLVNHTSPFFVCDHRGHGVLRRWAVWQWQQWLLELGPRQCQPSPFSIGHRDGQEPGPTDRWRTAHGAGPSRMWGAGGQEVQGENEKTVRLQNLRVNRQRFKNTTESHFVFLSFSELEQGSIQVSVAWLWESADITGWNETPHSHSSPGVSMSSHTTLGTTEMAQERYEASLSNVSVYVKKPCIILQVLGLCN